MKVIKLEQRTQEWYSWRNGEDLPDKKPRITATVAAVVMGCSVSRQTPSDLWREMTGRKKREAASAIVQKMMDHGTRMEPEARKAYESMSGNQVADVCVEHPTVPWAAASLDGATADGSVIVEIKCPYGHGSHDKAKKGVIPEAYYPQVQWQLFITGAKECHYFSYKPDDSEGVREALVVVKPDLGYIDELYLACAEFRRALVEDRSPVSDDWAAAALSYRRAVLAKEEAEANLAAATEALKALLPESSNSKTAGGVTVTRYLTKQTVDWAKALSDAGFDGSALDAAAQASRPLTGFDHKGALKEIGVDEATVGSLEERFGKRGEPDLKTAATLLGWNASSIKKAEEAYKQGGETRWRITVNEGDVTPEMDTAARQKAVELQAKATEASGDAAAWSGW
jgi:putative phage-type endonuclease